MAPLASHAYDLLLAGALLWLAWQATHAADLFRSVISFIVFGLLMALAWIRLDAPDIALAEAAIGAGVTGALLLSALGRLTSAPAEKPAATRRWPGTIAVLALAATVLAVLGTAAWQLPAPGLGEAVAGHMPRAGVDNPVTGVLLNFRAFDTLLEIGVLLLAVVAIWSLGPTPEPLVPAIPSPALPALGRMLWPMFVLATFYLLWRGTHAPGGAFQAGAVLGAGGILVILAGARPWLTGEDNGPWRWLLSLGVVTMLLAALSMTLIGQRFFEYPDAAAAGVILVLEITAAISIAMLLFAAYLNGQPPARWRGYPHS